MKICVYGLWHLGSVTAACLAHAKLPTLGLDSDRTVVEKLSRGIPPLLEPGLEDLVKAGLASESLAFTSDIAQAGQADLVWVTFDTPVNDADEADHAFVVQQVMRLSPVLARDAVVLISSQIPVGTTRAIADEFAANGRGDISFAYSPENLRLGRAIEVFEHPERIVVGCLDARAHGVIEPLLARFCNRLLWMSVESAEMVKHALNSFLALSIAYTNEIATLCEKVGADMEEVERGLRSEPRIGEQAYVRAGAAFAGGTLARDVRLLGTVGAAHGIVAPLLGAILPSNDNHRQWPQRRLREACGELRGKTVAVLGLTYKAGTSTLRRSSALELCLWLAAEGAKVVAFDPAVSQLPADLAAKVEIKSSAIAALTGADAVVIGTQWPEFRNLSTHQFATSMRTPLVVDQNRFMGRLFSEDSSLRYVTLGRFDAAHGQAGSHHRRG
jgi:UDPglucose 6-dehydrogenase